MHWVVNASVGTELALDVLVAEDPFLGAELVAVHTEKASVEGNGWQQGEGRRP